MIPAIAMGVSVGYSMFRAVDNGRYWYDYASNTGRTVRYPFRQGVYGDMPVIIGGFRNVKNLNQTYHYRRAIEHLKRQNARYWARSEYYKKKGGY